MGSIETGQAGEALAAEYLEKRGFRVLHRNWRSGRWGELDIVAVDSGTVVGVEVRTRKMDAVISPQASITPHKLKVLQRTLLHFLKSNPELPQAARLDLVSVEALSNGESEIRYYRNIGLGL